MRGILFFIATFFTVCALQAQDVLVKTKVDTFRKKHILLLQKISRITCAAATTIATLSAAQDACLCRRFDVKKCILLSGPLVGWSILSNNIAIKNELLIKDVVHKI